MTTDDPTLGLNNVELHDGTSATLEAGALWVTVDDMQIQTAMRVRDIRDEVVSMTVIHDADESPFDYPVDEFREDAANGDLFPLGYFLDNRQKIRTASDVKSSIPDMVMGVWGEYTEFQEYGPEYVSYLVEGDIREIRGEMQDQDEIDKEFADIAINAVRALEEFGSTGASELIRRRLEDRMAGDQEDIIERYTQMWTGHLNDPTDFKR